MKIWNKDHLVLVLPKSEEAKNIFEMTGNI